MQRYSSASLSGGVSNNAVGGPSTRENTRGESQFLNSSYSSNSRRPLPLTPYKLKCEREPLNSRLGPPDYHPQTPTCPEETLTGEYIQSGYRETVEGLEEAREIVLSQATYFTKPEVIQKCKEALRKRFRAIVESRAQKRKAGQVYGVPLSGALLIKPGVFPEQRACGEDSRRKWIEALSLQRKSLQSLADHVPHGYRKKSLFETLIRYNVPLLRATWFIKVTYLNQVHGIRPTSNSISSGTLDKSQFTRTDLWTKDVIEYLQQLLDEFFPKDGFIPPNAVKDHSLPTAMLGQAQQRMDSSPAIHDVEEPSLQFKWWYMVHLLHWHYAEGLLLPSLITEWVLNQLQEKDSAEALDLLLPIVSSIMESISSSQTHVRTFVDIAVRLINDLYPCDDASLLDYSKIPPVASSLIEMVHYLILSVPDTFVALDCSSFPVCVVPDKYFRSALRKVSENDSHDAHLRHLSIRYVVSTIQKRASGLAKVVNPSLQGHGAAKVVQVLDKSLVAGDVKSAYHSVFEDLSDMAIEQRWISEVSTCLRSSLEWIGTVSLSLICSIFFLCEWVTCDYRDCRTACPQNVKFTGAKDFSQVYFAVLLLKRKMEDMHNLFQSKNGNHKSETSASLQDNIFGGQSVKTSDKNNVNYVSNTKRKGGIFQSPGPLHDIIVCWIDQHEMGKGRSLKLLQVLLVELIRNGIFYPQAYLRQLIICGIMDRRGTTYELERRGRHQRILKLLPGSSLSDALEAARIAEAAALYEAVRVYSNERQIVLRGHLSDYSSNINTSVGFAASEGGILPTLKDCHEESNINTSNLSSKHSKTKKQIAELKNLISSFLHLPCDLPGETQHFEANGSNKRPLGSSDIKVDLPEATAGCDECHKAKRQKLADERNPFSQAFSLNQSDDDDNWWARKVPKFQELSKIESLKLAKNASRGRQKVVRKTQSLAQLAASRIESSQGASTSHVCDNKETCPHHKSGSEGEVPKSIDHLKTKDFDDIVKSLKQLRLLEKRSISVWLLTLIKQLVEGSEKNTSKPINSTSSFGLDNGNNGHWKLGEVNLSVILCILDISCDLLSAVRLILWLLRKLTSGPSPSVRNMSSLTKNRESSFLQVGESFLLSSLQRYENIFVAADLLPDVLSTAMHRAVSTMASNGRTTVPLSFSFARHILKKYRDISSVIKWEKNFRATCDQRLLVELDTGRTMDEDLGFSSGVSTGTNDFDEYFRQKMSGRISRTGQTMKDLVQRNIEDYLCGKERKPFVGGGPKLLSDKWDSAHQVAQDIVRDLLNCIRQNGGATIEGDPSIVASAVSAIVSNVGPAIAKSQESYSNSDLFPSTKCPSGSIQNILHIHINSLGLLKEALGERLGRIFDLSLAAEASTVISGAYIPGKVHRSPFQSSPESYDVMNNSTKQLSGRAAKAASAVSALVVGVIIHGITSLERMIVLFKLKEGLDVLQFIRSTRSSSNGMSRGSFKLECSIEVYVHWFRLFIGNCRTILDGLVAEVLGEPYVLALSRLQRMLPLSVVFPPAYSVFAMVIWRPFILNSSIATREDIQLYHNLSLAICEAIRHYPFRDLCLRNTHVFYEILASDVGDSEFAAMLEMHNPDKHLKTMAFVPLRARMFLNSLIDCRMPPFTLSPEDGSRGSGSLETRTYANSEPKLVDNILHVFDTLQPAKFHWQWLELRLLLNEQALIEKIETKDISFVDAIRSLSPNAENFAVSESEKFLSEIVLTRLLVRPDAAPLYAEIAHLLGRSLEESLVMDIKWLLAGGDVLSGRKSIRQQLISLAQRKGFSIKTLFWKPWGWSSSTSDILANRSDRSKIDGVSIEEGEVVDEFMNTKRPGKMNPRVPDTESVWFSQQYVTEKALADLILPCIDRSSSDLRNSLAAELIKQMSTVDQQINTLTHGGSKQANVMSVGIEGSSNKSSNRKSMRGGSPGLGRRSTGVVDSSPPSAAALRASIWLRLQFIIRLLLIVYADREPPPRNMRHTLAGIILHLLGTRFIQEDSELSVSMIHGVLQKRDMESSVEIPTTSSSDQSGDSLFETFLSVLHGLLSSCRPSWLKTKPVSKSTAKSRDFSAFDREVGEILQSDLDRMELPTAIRHRIQSAMPILPPSPPISLPCNPPTLSPTVLSPLQPNSPNPSQPFQRPAPHSRPTKGKALVSDSDTDIDPWTLLEDGTTSSSASNSTNNAATADHSNFKACSWLKGAVRVRRTELTYVGTMDEDS